MDKIPLREKVKKPLRHVHKVKEIKWLLPFYVFYRYYKLGKNRNLEFKQKLNLGFSAEATRFIAFITVPLPGSYELSTVTLVLLAKRIERGEIEPRIGLALIKDHKLVKLIKEKKDNVIFYLKNIEIKKFLDRQRSVFRGHKEKILNYKNRFKK